MAKKGRARRRLAASFCAKFDLVDPEVVQYVLSTFFDKVLPEYLALYGELDLFGLHFKSNLDEGVIYDVVRKKKMKKKFYRVRCSFGASFKKKLKDYYKVKEGKRNELHSSED